MERDKKGTWVWRHNAYDELDPISQNFQTESWSALHDQLLVPYRQKYPDTTFVLVGHSLGGVVAFEEIVKYVDSPSYPEGFLSAVVTVDSPLHGVRPEFVTLGVLRPELACVTRGPAATLLAGIHNNEPETTTILTQKVARAKQQGVRVATAGNVYDCVWAPSTCGVPLVVGDIGTQWVNDSDAMLGVFALPEPCLDRQKRCFVGTHLAPLQRQNQKRYPPDGLQSLRTIAEFVGRQN
jgi:hypothetical protein